VCGIAVGVKQGFLVGWSLPAAVLRRRFDVYVGCQSLCMIDVGFIWVIAMLATNISSRS
jgi:hypothetical protein